MVLSKIIFYIYSRMAVELGEPSREVVYDIQFVVHNT